jgi:Uma2 family endonuclease
MTLLERTRPKARGTPLPLESQPHPGRRMTEEQFVQWVGEKTRAEWVDGEVLMMSPVGDDHDQTVRWFDRVLGLYAEAHALGVMMGPEFMVRFARQALRRLPDLMFISKARASRIRKTYVEGAPDLIIEVVSPDSTARDWREKYLDYEKAGVREYWIIDRAARRIEAYVLTRRGTYRRIKETDGRIRSSVVKGFFVELKWALGDTLPPVSVALRALGVRV